MCGDYDLCENCEPNALIFHDPEHIFIPYKTEYVKPVEEKKEEEMDTTPDAQEKQDPNKPLTEEEKEERKKKLMKKVEKEKEEEEFKKQKEELRRRKENKESREAKEKWEAEKARIQREKEKKEREEKKERHKREILERMEEEKKARLAQTTQASTNTEVIAPKKTEQDYNTCTIQIKLTNGQTLKQTFNSSDTLLVVHDWVSKNRTDGAKPFALCNTFPRKVFSEQELKTITLIDAKLVPRGALIIQNK